MNDIRAAGGILFDGEDNWSRRWWFYTEPHLSLGSLWVGVNKAYSWYCLTLPGVSLAYSRVTPTPISDIVNERITSWCKVQGLIFLLSGWWNYGNRVSRVDVYYGGMYIVQHIQIMEYAVILDDTHDYWADVFYLPKWYLPKDDMCRHDMRYQ